jgi:hypothetical protein
VIIVHEAAAPASLVRTSELCESCVCPHTPANVSYLILSYLIVPPARPPPAASCQHWADRPECHSATTTRSIALFIRNLGHIGPTDTCMVFSATIFHELRMNPFNCLNPKRILPGAFPMARARPIDRKTDSSKNPIGDSR